MKQEWGREGYAGDWPSSKLVWTIGAFFLALASVAAICALAEQLADRFEQTGLADDGTLDIADKRSLDRLRRAIKEYRKEQ